MLSSLGSLLGGVVSTYGAGVAVGKVGEKLGKTIDKKLGAAIGFMAGAGGGMIVGFAVKKISDVYKEDDCVITARLFNAVVVNLAVEYMLDENECDILVKKLNEKSKDIAKLQTKILKSERQYFEIKNYLEVYFEDVIAQRIKIDKEMENQVFVYE